MVERVYLDANATAPLLPEARAATIAALQVGNPSSVHKEGRGARAIVETARRNVAALVNAKADHVVFTSGATEAAATALSPDFLTSEGRAKAGRLYVSAVEHPCVLAGGRFGTERAQRLPVDDAGRLRLDALDAALARHDAAEGRPVVALMLANNETGVIQPVLEAAAIARRHGAILFCDAVQAVGRIPVDIEALGVDLLGLSSHKIGGPQGAGALVLRDDRLRPAALLTGGGQERSRRAGTENVAAIAGFGVAAEAAAHHLREARGAARLRNELEAGLRAISPDVTVFGAEAERLPNTCLFAVPGVKAETRVIALDLLGFAVSSGSACSSGKVGASHVLEAMGAPAGLAAGSIRVSLTPQTRGEEIEAFLAAWRGLDERPALHCAA